MNKHFRWVLGWLMAAPVLMCRLVTTTLWISGGSDGIVYAGEKYPGWLGVAQQLDQEEPRGCWLDIGGTRDWPVVQQAKGLRIPDAVVPSEGGLTFSGPEVFDLKLPWVLSNVRMLPQFPGKELPVPTRREWTHPDGFRLEIQGLLDEKAPLRIPPSRLRPLWITDPVDALQQQWTTQPPASNAFQVVVLPEHGDFKTLTAQIPEAHLLVEPPGNGPRVIELGKGQRLRVRPGRMGRAMIRVDVRWDTVQKQFLPPRAEVVWVRPPDLEKIELPDALVKRVRPMANPSSPVPDFIADLKQLQADVLLPTFPRPVSLPAGAVFPDTLKRLSHDQDLVMMRYLLSPEELVEFRALELPVAPLRSSVAEEAVLVVPVAWAAGNSGDGWMKLRAFLDRCEQRPSVMSSLWESLP